MGVAPTGREMTLFVIVIHRIEGGKVAEEWGLGTIGSTLREQLLEQERIERELGALSASTERLAALEALPDLVEEYIRELPYLVQGPPRTIRDYVTKEELCAQNLREEKCCDKDSQEIEFEPYLLTPGALRERTPEEREELRRAEEQKRGSRYRAMYDLLGLKIVVQKCGTLELFGRFGVRSIGRGEEPNSVWKSVTRASAEDLPSPESFFGDEEGRCSDRRSPRSTPIATTVLPFSVRLDAEGTMSVQLVA